MKEAEDPRRTTLSDDDIEVAKPKRVGRREAVALGGVGVASAVALATGCGRRRVVTVQTVQAGLTDGDSGPCADPAGGGRGHSGITDRDNAGCADPVGRGRGGGGYNAGSGITDSDAGPNADAPGYGRGGGRSGISDSDAGPCADPAGGGRGFSGTTDGDSGPCADPGGRGRRGY